ncbi:MAG: hypothetical protein ABEJ42_00575 [Halobacteriaceae archaeon]
MLPFDRRTVLLMAAGLLCYVAGMLVLFVGAVGAFLSMRSGGSAAVVLPYLVVGVVLVVVGRAIGVVFGGPEGSLTGWLTAPGHSQPHQPSDQNALERLGYVQPEPESPAETAPGADSVRCPECGAVNEATYSYCGECSASLPD